ncbi:hypothetical protein CYMTET_5589 [Cymbomonas tetramitiformis]|uniref:Reverse transcriptase/retrotransposon-derived protein RNase H-like domain-containing protein n=1 Tax=Cymbomonas tetramitiformis TaxID=36881 RepID=A0AAE0GZ55_9CHLO|nr:hypothetical protein CYMTET_5589 [Cymbomonas tetramitiformis]
MDALWGFWQIPIGADDVEKTAMTTHFGAYEWLVMPMGLSNSPSTWQRMMTQYLGHLPFCRVFVDDIMIFSAEVPGKSAHETFADLAYPLTRLTKSGVEWTWGENEKAAFKQLKTALISSPALALPDQKGAADGSRPFFVQTDASGVALGGVLMQDQGRGLQPLAFESRQFSSAEQNYHTGERELCAIHHCTTVTWRHYLFFTSFKLMGDHKPLQWLFAQARELSRRQARWYEDLVEVGVHQMEHVPGRCLVVPDAQSRRPDYQEMSAREGLKEKGIVDRATDGPRDSEPKGKGSEEDEDPTSVLGIVDRATDGPRDSEPKGKRSEEDEDPTSVLGATFEYSDSEDESFPPTSPSPVIGELTHLNGLTWVETPALWLDAADTLAVGEKSLRDAESLAVMTRANRAREHAAAEVQSHPEAAKEAPEAAESPHPETQSHPKAARKAPEPVKSPEGSSHYDQVADRQDWKLIRERFEEIAAQYGMFDVDACCDSMGVN